MAVSQSKAVGEKRQGKASTAFSHTDSPFAFLGKVGRKTGRQVGRDRGGEEAGQTNRQTDRQAGSERERGMA